jgi:hypothetical protein
MDDYADIYYVDTRNADSRDHRTQSGGGARPGWAPSAPTRTVYVPPSRQPMGYAQPYAQPVTYAQPAPMIYQAPYPQQSLAASFFGKLTTGQVVEMVAQLFAALQPLPAAPVATRNADTDVGNLILFNGALASHAKRDEQIRTLGGLVGKVVG